MSYVKFFILAAVISILPVFATGSAYAFNPSSFLSQTDTPKKTRLEERLTLRPVAPPKPVTLFQKPSIKDSAGRNRSGNRIFMQALLGTATTGAMLMTLGPLAIGLAISEAHSQNAAYAGLVTAAVVPTVATAGIVYLVGRSFDGSAHGSFWATLGGTATAAVLAVGLVPSFQHSPLAFGLMAMPALGGILGYSASRLNHQSGAINIRDGKFKPGIPSTEVNLIPGPDGKKDLEYRMNVLSVSF